GSRSRRSIAGCIGSPGATWSLAKAAGPGASMLMAAPSYQRQAAAARREADHEVLALLAAHAQPGVGICGAIQAEKAVQHAGHQVHAGADVLVFIELQLDLCAAHEGLARRAADAGHRGMPGHPGDAGDLLAQGAGVR